MGDGEKRHIPSFPTLQKNPKTTRGSLLNSDSELSLLCTQNSRWCSWLGSSNLLSYLRKTKGPNFVIAPEHPFSWITVAIFSVQIICVCWKNMNWLIHCFLIQNYTLHSLKYNVYISFFWWKFKEFSQWSLGKKKYFWKTIKIGIVEAWEVHRKFLL